MLLRTVMRMDGHERRERDPKTAESHRQSENFASQSASPVQADQAANEVKFAAIVRLDHPAQGPAGVHDRGCRVIPVRVEQQDTERSTYPPHTVARRGPGRDIDPEGRDPGVCCFDKGVFRSVATSDLHLEFEVLARQRDRVIQSVLS